MVPHGLNDVNQKTAHALMVPQGSFLDIYFQIQIASITLSDQSIVHCEVVTVSSTVIRTVVGRKLQT